ncbi:ABC transporter ATP-binding protein [Burkholderia latens]|uniref:ABC transporter ATP-binding protein n=1 Tax=Burkholderia latens TaxID=488446 RepID=UPI00158AA89C|nr:ATP-binding cassette domain-containing protein [Burkholderia latens]
MTTPTGLIDAQRITRRDATTGKTLLAPTDFSLAAGSRIAITGPSGSGKSVLLRALALLDPLDGGHVLWRGKRIRRGAIPRYRRSVAYVRQRPAQMDGTVEAQLRYPYSLAVYRGATFDRARVQALAARAGRGADFLDKRASELSGGEAQIAALLRVLQLDPDVLLLDEPTSALDPDSTRAIEALVSAWFDAASDTRAYVWISHDPAQAARVATMQLVMQAGVLHGANQPEAAQ